MKQMHTIQRRLLELSDKDNLSKISLRDMAEKIGMPGASPQKIKHHLVQLQRKGFLLLDRTEGLAKKTTNLPGWAEGLLKKTHNLFSIPIIGTANCGPATIFAQPNFQGFLRVSSKLLGLNNPRDLFAIKAVGSSMNRADIDGKTIEDGDFVIIHKENKHPVTGDIVLAIIDDKATIKRFIKDTKNGQIVLKADSSSDYDPIYLHPRDAFSINGKVVGVVKKPKTNE